MSIPTVDSGCCSAALSIARCARWSKVEICSKGRRERISLGGRGFRVSICNRLHHRPPWAAEVELAEYTRRDFGKLALSTLPAATLVDRILGRARVGGAERPNSIINGVRVGTITYSYRSMPDQSGDATLQYVVDSGISAIELMNGPAEQFAGAPAVPRVGGGGRRGQPPTPEQQTLQREATARMKQWRLSVSMDKNRALRKKYNDAGVTMYAWKCLNPSMSDEEMEYVFNVAEALGCTHTTLELTDNVEQLKRIGGFA